MKVVAFNGSPQKDGNTSQLIDLVFAGLTEAGIETEKVHVRGKDIGGCIACMGCFKNKDKRCTVASDKLNEYVEKMMDADGIILGSPTYFANVSTAMKSLIDRAGLVAFANDQMFKRKVGAGVVAVRRGGAVTTFDALNHFFLISQMIVPGSCYWNFGIGMQPGDIESDDEGLLTMKILGENMAWTMKKLND